MADYMCEGCNEVIANLQGVAIRPQTYKPEETFPLGENVKDVFHVHADLSAGFEGLARNSCIDLILLNHVLQFGSNGVTPLPELEQPSQTEG